MKEGKLAAHVISVDGCLDALMIEEDGPEAGSGVCSHPWMLSSTRHERKKAGQEGAIREELSLIGPVEGSVAEEEKNVGEKRGEGSRLRLVRS